MPELKQCEFFLLRYVPDAVKDEFVNIGVVLLDKAAGEGSRRSLAELRFTRDWSRVRCLDPAADIGMLEALENDMRAQLAAPDGARELILKKLDDSFSNVIQLSAAKACLTGDPLAEMDNLARMYLETSPARKTARERTTGARRRIAARMRDAFEQAGVWPLLWHGVPVAKYTRPGDPLKIDCGYRPNGIIRLFHAVSLATGADAAKVLAFSYPQIQEGIARMEGARTELTAIVEERLDRDDEPVAFALEILGRHSIQVATTAEMDAIAGRARRELKL